MKALMIAPQPFFEPRGTPISTYQRLHGLAALDYEVDVVTYHVGREVDIPGVILHRIPNIPFITNVEIGPSWPKLFLDVLVMFKSFLLLLFNFGKYDVIHSHEEAAFFSIFLSKIFRVPHLYDMHSSLSQQFADSKFGHYGLIVKLFESMEKLVINTCDSVITIGTDLEKRVLTIKPEARHMRIENLPVHVTDPMPAPEDVESLRQKLNLIDKIPVVYTGTFEHYQGLDLLFDSARLAIEQNRQISLVLVGGRPEQIAYWQKEVDKLGIADNVVFVGTVTPPETLAYLELADILVSPRTEGLSVPLKIYTYMFSGKPTVATRLVAHTQVLDDNTAMLVEPTQEAFASGILTLVADSLLRAQLGAQARKVAKSTYNIGDYAAKLAHIYGRFLPQTQVVGGELVELK